MERLRPVTHRGASRKMVNDTTNANIFIGTAQLCWYVCTERVKTDILEGLRHMSDRGRGRWARKWRWKQGSWKKRTGWLDLMITARNDSCLACLLSVGILFSASLTYVLLSMHVLNKKSFSKPLVTSTSLCVSHQSNWDICYSHLTSFTIHSLDFHGADFHSCRWHHMAVTYDSPWLIVHLQLLDKVTWMLMLRSLWVASYSLAWVYCICLTLFMDNIWFWWSMALWSDFLFILPLWH